jgi:hypothetical protein
MISIPVYAIVIWSFFQPSIASHVFLISVACFEGWLLVAYSLGKPELVSSSTDWSEAELSALRKYHLAFRFPFAIKTITSGLKAISLSSFIWVPWLFYKHHWIPAVLMGLNSVFVLSYLQIRCSDPRSYLKKVVNAGNLKYYDELEAVDSIYEKLFKTTSGKSPDD